MNRRAMDGFVRRVAFGPAVVALAAGAACGPTGPSTPGTAVLDIPAMPPRSIVVLGDSLAISPSRTQNFPAELQARLNASGGGWRITNASVSGDTTAGGVRRFDQAVAADTRILVLELGANDGLRGVDIAAIERNLTFMIERAQARGIRVLLCGMETPPTHGWDYTIDYHRMFRRVAQTHNVALVPFLLAEVALNPDLNGPDGIHPNGAGARHIAETIWPYWQCWFMRRPWGR